MAQNGCVGCPQAGAVWLGRSKVPMVGKSLKLAAQIAAPVCCWVSHRAGGDAPSRRIPTHVASGLSCAQQPHVWHCEILSGPKLMQGAQPQLQQRHCHLHCCSEPSPCAHASSKGHKGMCHYLEIQDDAPEVSLQKAKLCWRVLALQVWCLPPSHRHKWISIQCRDAVPRHVPLVASVKGLSLQDTHVPSSSQVVWKILGAGAPWTTCWPVSSLSSPNPGLLSAPLAPSSATAFCLLPSHVLCSTQPTKENP